MSFGLAVMLIGCGLFLLAILIHWVLKLTPYEDILSPYMLGIGLLLVPVGLVIWWLSSLG